MSKKLIREYYQVSPNNLREDYLTESDKRNILENDTYYLTGLIQHANKLNGNGRVYPKEILQREVEYYNGIIEQNRALGELDHPEDAVVNLKNASHVVERIWWEGDGVYGKIRVLNHTPSGQILKGLIKDNIQIGVSSRGVGSVREEPGRIVVDEDFQLICFDVVQEPSTNNAFLVKEAKEYGRKFTKNEKIHQMLIDILG